MPTNNAGSLADEPTDPRALGEELEHPDTLEFLVQYGGRCRDCADVGPVCESTGIGCGERRKAMKFALDALAYGVRNGFVLQDALRHRFASPQTAGEDVVEQAARALYQCEKERSDHVDKLLSAAKGQPVRFRMEHWDDVADLYRSDARAALASLTAERDAALARCERLEEMSGEVLRAFAEGVAWSDEQRSAYSALAALLGIEPEPSE
jgi:hypothetical protein